MGLYSPNLLANCFISCIQKNPKGEIIIYGDRHITWQQFTSRVFRVANALRGLGVKKDDKVAFLFHNCPEFLEINFGIQVAGAIPVPMNYRFSPREVEYQGKHCDAKVFLYDSLWAQSIEPALPNLKNIKHSICKGKSQKNTLEYEDFVNTGDNSDPAVATHWEEVAVIIYTGGTTGFPKGVMLTYQGYREMFSKLAANFILRTLSLETSKEMHQRIIDTLPIPASALLGPILRTKIVKMLLNLPGTEALIRKQAYRYFSNPKIAARDYKKVNKAMYPSLPFFHAAAYTNLMLSALAGNICHVLIPSPQFDPGRILKILEQEHVSSLFNVPTGWKQLVSYPAINKYDRSSLRVAWTCGAPCPANLKKKILISFPKVILIDGFGQTEMTPITSFRIDVDPERIKDHSIGKPIVDFKVWGEKQNEVPPGVIGEILYRSNTAMKGYYKDKKKTREVMKDGWLKSGDLGFLDDSGEVHIVDRKQECINTGGEKIFPLELEEILKTHSKIEDVCIFGIPDEKWGQTVGAVVVLKSGERMKGQEVIQFCKGKMADYKVPRRVIFARGLPFSPAGKIQRQKVREIYGR